MIETVALLTWNVYLLYDMTNIKLPSSCEDSDSREVHKAFALTLFITSYILTNYSC
jgi:hypothetical protein